MGGILILLGFLLAADSKSALATTPESLSKKAGASRSPAAVISAPREPTAVDKHGYTLFDPTPDDQLREFNTDNGGVVNTPYTVDAGHFQIETELFNYFQKQGAASQEQSLVLNNLVFRLGLTHDLDFEIGFVNYVFKSTRGGLGDLSLLAKINFLGNDGGLVGIAVQPFVKFPTNTGGVGNGRVEGGAFLPINFNLTDDMSLTAQPIWYFNKNANDDRFHSEGGLSICWSRKLFGGFSTWLELTGMGSTEEGSSFSARATLAGVYDFTKNFDIDWGTFIGLTQDNPTFNPFLGISIRK